MMAGARSASSEPCRMTASVSAGLKPSGGSYCGTIAPRSGSMPRALHSQYISQKAARGMRNGRIGKAAARKRIISTRVFRLVGDVLVERLGVMHAAVLVGQEIP